MRGGFAAGSTGGHAGGTRGNRDSIRRNANTIAGANAGVAADR